MTMYNKIRSMREIHQWTQEQMAEKLGMSLGGYAKIERGETKLSLQKLEQIANIFNMDALEFMQSTNKGVYFMMNDNGDNTSANYYGSNDAIAFENEQLKRTIQHKDEIIQNKIDIIEQQRQEISLLKEIIEIFKARN